MENLIENKGASLDARKVNKIINDYQKIKRKNDTLTAALQDLNQKLTSAASVKSTTPTISVEEHEKQMLELRTEITSLKQEVVVGQEKITELLLQIENANKNEQKTNGHVESKEDKTNPDADKVTQQAQIIKDLKQEVNKHKATLKELTELKEKAESNALLIQESLKKEIDKLNTTPYSIKPAIMHEAQIKQKRAENAIEHLKTGISNATTPTDADKALEGIIACLTAGLEQADPKIYFEQNKDLLKKHVNTLQYTLKSFVNTAVNAILTVLAICSIVGITALWLTGTLQSNLENKGSSFAFWTYGHKQKAEQDIHLATSAMLGMTKGG